MSQIHIAPYAAEHNQRPKQEGQSKEKIAHHTMALLIDKHHTDEEGWENNDGEVEIIS